MVTQENVAHRGAFVSDATSDLLISHLLVRHVGRMRRGFLESGYLLTKRHIFLFSFHIPNHFKQWIFVEDIERFKFFVAVSSKCLHEEQGRLHSSSPLLSG